MTMTLEVRFWSKVERLPSGCWVWTGYRMPGGYGQIRIDGHTRLAHRVAYALASGESPDGWEVCHQCDNPPCCNPAHLFLGTHRDNMRDHSEKGRARGRFSDATHCLHGHEFTPENTRISPKHGTRVCRACHRRIVANARRSRA